MPWMPRQAGFMASNHQQIYKREVAKLGAALIKKPNIRTGFGGKKKGK